jgi:hypothetical protein
MEVYVVKGNSVLVSMIIKSIVHTIGQKRKDHGQFWTGRLKVSDTWNVSEVSEAVPLFKRNVAPEIKNVCSLML